MVPPEIAAVAAFALHQPVRVEVGVSRAVVQTVKHAMYPVAQVQKFELLLALLLLVLATLPLVGIDLWRDWLNGLSAYQESQQYLNGLYGVGLGRYLPMWAFLAIAALTLVAALWVRGREGLARLGLASVVASPSLWSHGFVFGIPSFLRLRAE